MNEQVRRLLHFNRSQWDTLPRIDEGMMGVLLKEPLLCERLRSMDGVGEITAWTWALETGDPARFPNGKHAIRYGGWCAAQRASAGVAHRGPIAKPRNAFWQTTLLAAAQWAPPFKETLRAIRQAELAKGQAKRATWEVARRGVRYWWAVDRQHFQKQTPVAAGGGVFSGMPALSRGRRACSHDVLCWCSGGRPAGDRPAQE
jgi:transposase